MILDIDNGDGIKRQSASPITPAIGGIHNSQRFFLLNSPINSIHQNDAAGMPIIQISGISYKPMTILPLNFRRRIQRICHLMAPCFTWNTFPPSS